MSVEFLDEPAAPPDERARSRRVWPLLIGLVLVAVAAAWVIARQSPAPAAIAHPDPRCRGIPDCGVYTGATPAFGRLVRADLGREVQLDATTVVAVDSETQEDLLVARDLDVVAEPGITILIRVSRGGPDTGNIVPAPPGVRSVLLHRINSGFVVRLQYLAPDPLVPPLDQLRALIRDPRLATTL